jgi:RNA polymerase sigma-70 factor (ECF subfamily)
VADVDAELVEALSRGDADGAEQLVERYGGRTYRLALQITGRTQDAEEAVEEGLRTAIGMIHTFTGASTFESWIVRSVASVAYRRLRRRGRGENEIRLADVVPAHDGDGHLKPMDDWSNRIDEEVRRPDLDGILSEAIDGLPADCRTALVLHDVEYTSNPEIAAILGVDGPGVARRVHIARLFVRKRLSEYFASAAAA